MTSAPPKIWNAPLNFQLWLRAWLVVERGVEINIIIRPTIIQKSWMAPFCQIFVNMTGATFVNEILESVRTWLHFFSMD